MHIRRHLLALGLVATTVPALVLGATSATATTRTPASHLSGTVTLITSAGSQGVAYGEVAAGFTAETGVKVNIVAQVGPSSFGQISAQASDPVIGVVGGSPGNEVQLQGAHLLQQLPKGAIPNESRISKNIVDVQPPSKFDVPIDTDTNGLEYNKDIFAAKGLKKPTSYTDLLNPALCGHIAIYGPDVPSMEAWFNQLADADHGSATNLQPAYSFMKQLAPCLEPGGIKESTAAMDQGFEQGLTWIAYNSSSRTSLLAESGVPVAFATNTTPLISFNVMSLVKGSPNQAASLALINYFLTKKAQDQITQLIAQAPVERGIVVPPQSPTYSEVDIAYGKVKYFAANWYALIPNLTTIIEDFDSEVG